MRRLTSPIVVVLLGALAVSLCGCGGQGSALAGREGPAAADGSSATYSISGFVKLNPLGRAGLAGVTVKALQGTSQAGSATTDLTGKYTITGLAAGRYTVVPSLDGFTFTPKSQRSVGVPPSKRNVDFKAAGRTFSIAGQVRISARRALAGVTVRAMKGAMRAGETTTNSLGNYSIAGLPAGGYTVIPSLDGYTFTPRSQRNITVPPSRKNVSFTAFAIPTGGLSDGIADPPTGAVTTTFVYLVTYTSSANQPPVSAAVIVDPGTNNETKVPMTKHTPGTDYAHGIVYMAEKTLTVGDHTYRFEFQPVPNKKWTLSGTGPTVTPE